MKSEQQYIDLYQQASQLIKTHSADVLNAVRDEAFADFKAQGFPTKKVERYKYTDMAALFAPDYGLNLKRLPIPVDPYETFTCDVPNLSTSVYFVVNDGFYTQQAARRRHHRLFKSRCSRTSRFSGTLLCGIGTDKGRCYHGVEHHVGARWALHLCAQAGESRPHHSGD